MNSKEAAAMIDISAVRTGNTMSDILEIVSYAKKYRFINVHVLPCWVSELSGLLKDVDGVYVGSPVGFPAGANRKEIKLLEAEQLLEDGVQEMDIVMNIGKFRSGDFEYVSDELHQIIDKARGKALTKVIIEINALNDTEMLKACDLVMESGADFIKTGTGWIPGTANIDRIKMIKEHCGNRIKVKASGGIRTKEEFLKLADLGVERMGINAKSAIGIVEAMD